MQAVKVFIVDATPSFAAQVGLVVDSSARHVVVGVSTSFADGVGAALSSQVGLVMVDISHPDFDGAFLARRVAMAERAPTLLAMSPGKDSASVRKAYAGGMAGCLLKDADPDKVLLAMDVVMSGGIYLDPALFPSSQASPERTPSPFAVLVDEEEDDVVRLTARGYAGSNMARALRMSPAAVEAGRERALARIARETGADLERLSVLVGRANSVH